MVKNKQPKAKKTKPAHVSIRLPDGTKIEADGPMAEVMAKKLMDPTPNWWYPYYWYNYQGNWKASVNANGGVYGGQLSACDTAQYVAQMNQDRAKVGFSNQQAQAQDAVLPNVTVTRPDGSVGSITGGQLASLVGKGTDLK